MHKLRSTGTFVVVIALFCLLLAVDKYYSAVKTAEVAAQRLQGFELESVGVPLISWVAGFLGVMLLVAGSICVAQSFARRPADDV